MAALFNTTTAPKLDIVEKLESFLYTPYGVSTLAVVAMLFASLFWCLACCLYCCIRRRRGQEDQGGVLEANREMDYYGVLSVTPSGTNQGDGGGTLSSGYNTAPTAYSDSLRANTGQTALSLDSLHATFTSQDSIIAKDD